MALSFKESKRMTDESPVMTMEATMEDARPVVDYDEDITTFDTGDQNFTRSGNYTWYDTFSDNDFSTVDTNKEITLSPTQVNITQENNSQVIPFEMPRYYDGVDLMGMTIQIHYVNANNAENYAAPINVSYSDDKIRFYWMVSDYATVKDGVLKFEIMATGAITVPSSGESKNYLWRTKPNEKLNVLKSLTGTAMNDPTGDDWYTQFLSTMSQKVGEAQTAATLAAQSAKDAQAVVDGEATRKMSAFLQSPKPELLHHQKFFENGTAERAKESGTEQNYNMIDGCVNNAPKKPRRIGGRWSVLDRLHIKQAERRQKDNTPQQEQERSRKS